MTVAAPAAVQVAEAARRGQPGLVADAETGHPTVPS